MRETGAVREFIRGTHVVPQVHGHHRQAVVLGENDFKAILQLVLFELERRYFEGRGLGRSWPCGHLCCRFRWRLRWRRRGRLRPGQTCKAEKSAAAKRINNLAEMTHHHVLS